MSDSENYRKGYNDGWTGRSREDEYCPVYNGGYNAGARDRQQEEEPTLQDDIDFFLENY